MTKRLTEEELEDFKQDLEYWWEEPESDAWFEKVGRIIRQTPDLIDELQQHRRIARELAELGNPFYHIDDHRMCHYCRGSGTRWEFRHADDCLWVRANKLLQTNDVTS